MFVYWTCPRHLLFGEQEIVDLAAGYNITFCSGGIFKTLMRDRFLLSQLAVYFIVYCGASYSK